jgi:hypothetical protein
MKRKRKRKRKTSTAISHVGVGTLPVTGDMCLNVYLYEVLAKQAR